MTDDTGDGRVRMRGEATRMKKNLAITCGSCGAAMRAAVTLQDGRILPPELEAADDIPVSTSRCRKCTPVPEEQKTTDYEEIVRREFTDAVDVRVETDGGRVSVSFLAGAVTTGMIGEMAEHGLELDCILPQGRLLVGFVGKEEDRRA